MNAPDHELSGTGSLGLTDVGILTAVLNVIRNAFINAFEAELEGSVNPSDVGQDGNQ